ncbi:hypothetical protein [Breoghania sp.]|uniref:hypothetical protein n=1 Tax=Breoghania sp. TaxID=2065378 RepID=UPI00262566D4|nr:hypothetical protein [Breoghania sp.]MDJ0933370.1 hypothetical protein [Breoghania sp.]
MYEDAVEQQTVHAFYAAGLATGVGDNAPFHLQFDIYNKSTSSYLSDRIQSLDRIANGIRLREFRLTDDALAEFSAPTIQYTLRLQPRDARALRLQRQYETWGEKLSAAGFNITGRVAFDDALRYARLRQVSSDQVLPWEAEGVFGVAGVREDRSRSAPWSSNDSPKTSLAER